MCSSDNAMKMQVVRLVLKKADSSVDMEELNVLEQVMQLKYLYKVSKIQTAYLGYIQKNSRKKDKLIKKKKKAISGFQC